MTGKKVAFHRVTPKSADDWVTTSRPEEVADVSQPAPETEPMKRLTIDVPRSLHSRIKAACALRGSKMADEIRTLLEREFVGPQQG